MKETKGIKLVGGTLFYGVVVNFIILVIVDSRKCDSEFGFCNPYVFLLLMSLIVGFVVSYLTTRRRKPG